MRKYTIEVRVKREVLRRATEFLRALQLSYSAKENANTGIHIVISGGRLKVKMKLSDYEKGEEIANVTISENIDVYIDSCSRPVDKRFIFHVAELHDKDIAFLSNLGEGFDDILIVLDYNNGEEKVFVKDRKITFEV